MIDVSENCKKTTVCIYHSLWLNLSLSLHIKWLCTGEKKQSNSQIRKMKHSFKVLGKDESKASFLWLTENGWSNRCVVKEFTACIEKQHIALRDLCTEPMRNKVYTAMSGCLVLFENNKERNVSLVPGYKRFDMNAN